MPVVLFIYGFKFKFYSNENDEPPHIHVLKGGGNTKYWLMPEPDEAYSYGYTVRERRQIKELVLKNHTLLISKWNEFFGR
ncbi:MAG: DUF4160 domain-containing protein [Cytophagaceae bacterium]|nr:DUF4160 domain-containing protein [Cytophagaceae bacterium]